jgi:hypothetical protein
MRSTYHSGRKTALLYLLGALFCGLLVAFAVGAKLAAYYPHNDAARSIASTKVWQQYDAVETSVPSAQVAPAVFFLVLAFAALAVGIRSVAWLQTAPEFTSVPSLCFDRAHAIRPPPRS